MIVGIDPGLKGSLVARKHSSMEILHVLDFAKHKNYVYELSKYLKENKENIKIVIMEMPHAIFGAGARSTFQFGKNCGLLEGVLISLDMRYSLVAPKEWQKKVFLQIKSDKSAKEKAKEAFSRLFLREHSYSDGVIDAALISLCDISSNI